VNFYEDRDPRSCPRSHVFLGPWCVHTCAHVCATVKLRFALFLDGPQPQQIYDRYNLKCNNISSNWRTRFYSNARKKWYSVVFYHQFLSIFSALLVHANRTRCVKRQIEMNEKWVEDSEWSLSWSRQSKGIKTRSTCECNCNYLKGAINQCIIRIKVLWLIN